MYRYLKGVITEINTGHITVECYNIGYLIRVANPYLFTIGTDYTIHLYQHVREDILELYGFQTAKQRDLFVRFLDVKGLGPKGALAILATASPEEIVKAIDDANAKFFTRFSGIGPKTSQQIVLDLKGKINFDEPNQNISPSLLNVEAALKALGYRNAEIKNILTDLKISDDIPTSEAVKMVLRKLNK